MTDLDQTFRIVLIAAFAAILPFGLYHRIRSQATGERLDRRREGSFILFTLRPVGLLSIAGAIAFMINPASMAWSSLPLPAWLRWAGVVVAVVADSLMAWTLHSLGRNLTDTVVTRKTHTLVTFGPYRWIRHPFYASAALWVIAASLIAANWFVFVTGSLALSLLAVRTKTEEALLVDRFGNDYRNYMAETGRFLPKLW